MKKLFSLFLIGMSVMLGACTQIDTGNVGVESTFGQVKKEVLPPGVYFTAFKSVTEVLGKEVPVSLNDLHPQTSDKITLKDFDVDIYVQSNTSKAPEIMTRWPGDLTAVDKDREYALGINYVTRQAREAIYTAVATHNSSTVHTERAELAAQIQKDLQQDLDASAGKGFYFIRSVNVRNLVTDPALEENIKAAAKAQFAKAAKDQEIEVARKEAERKRIEAQGDADAIRIKAEAISKQGGEDYVKLKAIEKWDGKLPSTNAGAPLPFVPLK